MITPSPRVPIVEVQQVGDLMLLKEPGRVDLVEVDQKIFLNTAAAPRSCRDQKRMVVDLREIADRLSRGAGRVKSIKPLPPVATGLHAELVDDEALLIDIGRERALEHGIKHLFVAADGHPFEALAAGSVGAPAPGTDSGATSLPERIGASRTRPFESVWSRNGPNSSPNHRVPSCATRTDSMSKSPPVSSRFR